MSEPAKRWWKNKATGNVFSEERLGIDKWGPLKDRHWKVAEQERITIELGDKLSTPPPSVEEIEKLIDEAIYETSMAVQQHSLKGLAKRDAIKAEAIAAVRQLAGDCEMHSGIALSALAKATELQAELVKAKEEIAVLSEPDDLSDDLRHVEKLLAEAFVGKHTTIIGKGVLEQWKRNMEKAEAELATLRAAGENKMDSGVSAGEGRGPGLNAPTGQNHDAELEGLLRELVDASQDDSDSCGLKLATSADAIRAHVAGMRQRIRELSLFKPVPDEELERAMASYGRTVEAVVIRKAVRALEQRIKELEEAHGSHDTGN